MGHQEGTEQPRVRLSGMLVEDGCMLAVHQVLKERSHWNLPGGSLETGERLDEALRREMREECGLEVEVGDLLYVTDRFRGLGRHVVDMCFEVHRIGGLLKAASDENDDEVLSEIEMVPIHELEAYGFSPRLAKLVDEGFPNRGSYQGDFHGLYG